MRQYGTSPRPRLCLCPAICPDPLTDAPWASFSDRSFLDRCWSEPNFLSRAGPEVLVAESVTAVRIRVG